MKESRLLILGLPCEWLLPYAYTSHCFDVSSPAGLTSISFRQNLLEDVSALRNLRSASGTFMSGFLLAMTCNDLR